MNLVDRLSILFVHTLVGALVLGFIVVSYSRTKYRLDHLDKPGFHGRNWSNYDFRSAEEAYYRPFRIGALFGAGIGALWGVVACSKRPQP